jgi:PAS domain S-box-containing protein
MYLIGTDGAIWKRFMEGEGNLPADLELYLEQMAGQTWRKARQIIVSDVREEHGDVPLALMERASVAAFVMLPMLREGRNLGALWALWPAPRPFSTSDVHFLSALASLGGIMIENNRIYHAVESERSRLAAILNSTPDTILVLDAEGRLQLANPAAEELLEFNFQERVGTPLPELISDDSLFRMLSDIARGRGPTTIELERDGRRLYVSASPIRLSGKTTPQGWVLVMRDITDWKRLDELQTDFVHTIAHDMKSPLTFVRGYASMLRDEAVSERQLEYIEKILKGIDDLTQLINELTELAEVSNKIGMTMTPVQLVTLVSEVAETMRTYAEGKGLSFLVELPADAPMVIGDPDRL